jgi:hypothetical protein
MMMNIKEAVKEYKCPGCVNGCEPEEDVDCNKHCAGTYGSGIGKLLLGMPKGFNRLGPIDSNKDVWRGFSIFKNLKSREDDGFKFDKFNIPVWKYLDEYGNTLVRGISPRINCPIIHVILENCMDKIDCLEITRDDLDGMD